MAACCAPNRRHDPERDRFVLSKGHAALALYATLAVKGWVSQEQLDTFCGDGSLLGVHPEAALAGVDFCSGSLGHGLSIAAGSALAARIQRSDRRAYCLLSDGECNEGSIWEAAMFAAHNRLSNLIAVADINGQQALGLTRDVCASANMCHRWEAFGWDVAEVDGHSVEALTSALRAPQTGKPRIVLAQTTFGCGVPFMEQGIPISQKHLPVQHINWHYLPDERRGIRAGANRGGAGLMRKAFIDTLFQLADSRPAHRTHDRRSWLYGYGSV